MRISIPILSGISDFATTQMYLFPSQATLDALYIVLYRNEKNRQALQVVLDHSSLDIRLGKCFLATYLETKDHSL
jgi:hypothetical protein